MTREENIPPEPGTSTSTSSRDALMIPRLNSMNSGKFSSLNSPTDSCYSYPPPYPMNEHSDEFSELSTCHPFNHENPQSTSGPSTSDQISPEPEPSTSSANNCLERDQLENKNHQGAGLKAYERRQLDQVISLMRKNIFWKTPAGEIVFHAAKDKFRQLLLAADPRLTKVEIIELGLAIEDIVKMRLSWVSSGTKRKGKKKNTGMKEKRRDLKRIAVVVSLILKSVEMIADIIVFFQGSNPDFIYPSELLLGFNTFALVFTGCFLIFYSFFYNHVDREPFSSDCMFCLIFAIIYISFVISSLEFQKSLVGAAIIYLIDMCFKKYILIYDDSPEIRYTPYVISSIPYIKRSGSSRVNSSNSVHYSVGQNRVRLSNSYTNECFVDDLPAGIDYTLNFKHMDNSYRILDLLKSVDRDSDVHPNFSERIDINCSNV